MSLGEPIPAAPHAVSVSLPTWADVIGYEEGDERVLDALQAGYPRFVFHPAVKTLMAQADAAVAELGDRALVLPSRAVAERCVAFLAGAHVRGRIESFKDLFAVVLPAAEFALAKAFWQHTGELVSSRRAEAALAGEVSVASDGLDQALRQRVAGLAGTQAADVSLYPTGMAALAQALRLVQQLHPGRPTAQLGFPYVDTLKLQQKLGSGAQFYARLDEAELQALERALAQDQLAGVFLELPGNPLMRSPDLARVARATRAAGVPLVVDDSIATFYNQDFLPYADLLVSSLTKSFVGQGTAMGGALLRVPSSPLAAKLAVTSERLLCDSDAAVLLAGSQDFAARMTQSNRTAHALVEALAAHPAVERVYYPSRETPEQYQTARRAGGGFGPMFSLLLADAATATPGFYDRLALQKGPSFGQNTTLVCPYTLLAHYTELDWAESQGVSRHLVRVSVGQEDVETLLASFLAALA